MYLKIALENKCKYLAHVPKQTESLRHWGQKNIRESSQWSLPAHNTKVYCRSGYAGLTLGWWWVFIIVKWGKSCFERLRSVIPMKLCYSLQVSCVFQIGSFAKYYSVAEHKAIDLLHYKMAIQVGVEKCTGWRFLDVCLDAETMFFHGAVWVAWIMICTLWGRFRVWRWLQCNTIDSHSLLSPVD